MPCVFLCFCFPSPLLNVGFHPCGLFLFCFVRFVRFLMVFLSVADVFFHLVCVQFFDGWQILILKAMSVCFHGTAVSMVPHLIVQLQSLPLHTGHCCGFHGNRLLCGHLRREHGRHVLSDARVDVLATKNSTRMRVNNFYVWCEYYLAFVFRIP